MNWHGIIVALLKRKEIDLPGELVREVIERHGAQDWFVYGHQKRREQYKNCWWPSLWLASRLSRSARILETGCGCGLNLLWFGQQGFERLHGFDIDQKAIAAGQELFEKARLRAHLWIDDGFSPAHIQEQTFDLVIALNWTYLLESFDLSRFLMTYKQRLNRNAYFVIDLIDSVYDRTPNNQYLTSDWSKPTDRRRPTEYKIRFSEKDVRNFAEKCGFRIVQSKLCWSKRQAAPKRVFILQSG
jgi:hypothetical protein